MLDHSDETGPITFSAGIQICELRTVEDTRQEVQRQLLQASRGVENKIKEAQTGTGVKDKVASYWIPKLLARARELKGSDPTLDEDSISRQCMEWLATQTSYPMNPLLDVPSKCLSSHLEC